MRYSVDPNPPNTWLSTKGKSDPWFFDLYTTWVNWLLNMLNNEPEQKRI